MRRLVQCSSCMRQYDASKQKVGVRFRCHCGEVLKVRAARGHEARVIRCSSCGGAREKGVNRCGYCEADFTIHERDLHTVCPHCFARCSDRARYCHDCGSMLGGEELRGDRSQLLCPACGNRPRLTSRQLGQERVSVLECPLCAGLWVGHDAFLQLKDRILRDHLEPDRSLALPPKPNQAQQQSGPLYRPCIYCERLMHRRSYGRGSGVVIDTCRKHGIWFDAEELKQVLDWISRGGKSRLPLSREKREPASSVPTGSPPRPQPTPSSPVPEGGDFLDAVAQVLFDEIWRW